MSGSVFSAGNWKSRKAETGMGMEGGGDQQRSPELLNKAFSTKPTQYMH
jgi:hypothetical protein